MYIIIGLLAIIAALFAVFLLKRKSSKNTTLLFIIFCSTQFGMAQSSQPKLVPIDGQGESPVFYDYQTSNVANQNTVPVTTNMNVQEVDIDVQVNSGDVFLERRQMRIETNPGARELTGAEAENIQRRMREAREEFEREYGANMPGEETEGDQRVLPTDQNAEEIARLRRQVQILRQEVRRLSAQDEEFEPEEDKDAKILIYCEMKEECMSCIQRGFGNFQKRYTYYHFLQRYYLKRMTDFQDAVAHADAVASIPGAGLGWAKIRNRKVMPSIDKFRKSYHKKFDEYIESMKSDLDMIRACYSGENSKEVSIGTYEAQVSGMIRALEISRINL